MRTKGLVTYATQSRYHLMKMFMGQSIGSYLAVSQNPIFVLKMFLLVFFLIMWVWKNIFSFNVLKQIKRKLLLTISPEVMIVTSLVWLLYLFMYFYLRISFLRTCYIGGVGANFRWHINPTRNNFESGVRKEVIPLFIKSFFIVCVRTFKFCPSKFQLYNYTINYSYHVYFRSSDFIYLIVELLYPPLPVSPKLSLLSLFLWV